MGDTEACDECKHKCLLLHGMRADPSPDPVTTFNKILFGGYDISKDLCLPRKIDKAIPNLVGGNKCILQDTNGHRWEVTLGRKDDHLAFREGWDKFYEDHGLTTGYVLAFHYIMNSDHFIVKIFDKTGFEKLKFPIANGKKGKKTEIDGNCNAIGEFQNHSNHSSKNQGAAFSGTSDSEAKANSQLMSKDKPSSVENGNCKYNVASANCDEEHIYMLNRDDGSKHEVERIPVLNLSNSEMPPGVDHDGRNSDKRTRPSNTAAESDAVAGNINENSVSAKVVRGEQAAEVDGSTLSNNNNITSERENVAEVDNDFHKRDQVYSDSRIKNSTASRKRIRKETAKSEKNSKKYPTKFNKRPDQIFGGEERDNEVRRVMKTEHVASANDDSLDASAFSFTAVVKSHEFLELAASVTLCADIEKKVVNLEGPDEKVWPVLYHHKRGIKALTSGWKNFSMSNRLQIEDACVFTLKNEVKAIFSITVKKE